MVFVCSFYEFRNLTGRVLVDETRRVAIYVIYHLSYL